MQWCSSETSLTVTVPQRCIPCNITKKRLVRIPHSLESHILLQPQVLAVSSTYMPLADTAIFLFVSITFLFNRLHCTFLDKGSRELITQLSSWIFYLSTLLTQHCNTLTAAVLGHSLFTHEDLHPDF